MQSLLRVATLALVSGAASLSVTMPYSAHAKVGISDSETKNQTEKLASAVKKATSNYIVQLKGQTAIRKAADLGELLPSNQMVALGNRYKADSPAMQAYTETMQARQEAVATDIGNVNIIHSYVHTFNGFAAKMTYAQAQQLKKHPDVLGVWEDQVFELQTSNTPTFLGLTTGPDGAHRPDLKGEGIIVGILDTGITPENPSFSDDGSYSDPADLGWSGICDAGAESEAADDGSDTFQCNNKLIGARFYNGSFKSSYKIQYGLGEFDSPRDADGHGSHTAGTAAGNEGVIATLNGSVVGTMSGIAPRARVAAYKVCWNSDYVNPVTNDPERGCFLGDSMAGIDKAVEDGVDVLNYSIGNSTDLTTPVYRAALDATAAGVFFAASAGNSGPEPETTGNNAPWMTTIAASTYDGISATNVLQVTSRIPQENIAFTEGGITKPLVETGDREGNLVIAEPLLGCFEGGVSSPLDNAADIAGNIALMSRGECAFTEKVERAQLAGAIAVVIYSDGRPVTVLGGNGSYSIPGGMISSEDGEALNDAITEGEDITIKIGAGLFADQVEVGNIMADFSSRGANLSTTDIIKPDITAPGVRILAATTSTPMFAPHGQQVKYLNGTSMSSPHIAGMAALMMSKYPDWTPAQVKSALMTTAYQDVAKEDAVTPADLFDFGAGHADPIPALEPGLTFDASYFDYMAFMCGTGADDFVLAQTEFSCEEFVAAGFAIDPSQLNYPSIAIGELSSEETIFRTVTSVADVAGTYTATIQMAPEINVLLTTFDSDGNPTADGSMFVEAGGTGNFALTFSKAEDAVENEWYFGSITWRDQNGHSVRSPIAVNAAPEILIGAPDAANIVLNQRGRAMFPVLMNYSGTTSMDYAGFVAPEMLSDVVAASGDAFFDMSVPEGSKLLRFTLSDTDVSVPGADLDLYLQRCEGEICTTVAFSWNFGSEEEILIVNPEAGEYTLIVNAWDIGDETEAAFDVTSWMATGPETSTRMRMSSRAIAGRYNRVSISTSGLEAGIEDMGAITFYDGEGNAVKTTVLTTTP